ncbi:unnamed protein product, partial [Ectocarpus fasciculatus]
MVSAPLHYDHPGLCGSTHEPVHRCTLLLICFVPLDCAFLSCCSNTTSEPREHRLNWHLTPHRLLEITLLKSRLTMAVSRHHTATYDTIAGTRLRLAKTIYDLVLLERFNDYRNPSKKIESWGRRRQTEVPYTLCWSR